MIPRKKISEMYHLGEKHLGKVKDLGVVGGLR
jgi:hypothetical protein